MSWLRRHFALLPAVVGVVVTAGVWIATFAYLPFVGSKYTLPVAISVLAVLLIAEAVKVELEQRPDIKFGDVLIAGPFSYGAANENLARLPITNEGATTVISVKLGPIDPFVNLLSSTPTLHREGDNPADGVSYSDSFELAHGATQAYDLVSAMQDIAGKCTYSFWINQVQGNRHPAPLNGAYECEVLVHSHGTRSYPTQKAKYRIRAYPPACGLTVDLLRK